MNLEDVDHAIFAALMENGSLTSNKLYKATNKIKSCAYETFNKHIKNLVKQKIINKKSTKNKQEYSINSARKDFHLNLLTILNERDDDLKEIQQGLHLSIIDYGKFVLEYKTNAETKKLLRQILDHYSRIAVLLLNQSQIELFFRLCGNKLISKKATKIHNRHIKQFNESLDKLQKIDYNAYKTVFSLVVFKMDMPIPGIIF